MGILARAMRGDRVDRATRSSAGRNLRPRDYPRPDGTAVVEHWLNQGITGHSRWIELAWLSIAASLLAILIRRFGRAPEKKSPTPLSAALCQDLEGVHSTRLLLAGSASLAVAYPSPRCCVFSAPWHFC